MITLSNTPHMAGIEISGDFLDLDTLYLALHTVVGDEGEFEHYEGVRLRVLGLCYDLRHAIQGDREFEFVRNGMDAYKMKALGLITPEKNLYYKCQAYYPEVLFIVMALNDFIRLYAKKQAKTAPFPLLDKRTLWDSSLASVRLFQGEVVKCLQQVVTEASFKRMMTLMHKDYPWTDGYATQYIDMLNIRYLNMEDKEERGKALSTIVKRLVEQGTEYRQIAAEVRSMARDYGCSADDIRLVGDYPDVEW